MILPSSRHLTLWILLSVTGLGAAFSNSAASLWQLLLGISIGAALVDGWLCFRPPQILLARAIHHNLPVTAWSRVGLKVHNTGLTRLTLMVHERCDQDLKIENQPFFFSLEPGGYVSLEYRVYPTKRGPYLFPGADVFVDSSLGLWQKKWFIACVDEVKVFPNFREIRRYALLATHHHLSTIGIKKLARRGEGSDFRQLREYRRGDELQKIDWKATSRYRRLISREYQDERDQQIVFVLDCGPRMGHFAAGKSHLDQALNSVLLLAYVAARQGDAVGLFSFGGQQKWLPPQKREDSIRTLLLGMYDLEASTETSDYIKATGDLLSLQLRRSLMIVITSSRSENHEDLLNMSRQLRSRHLVIIADLRETLLDDNLHVPVVDFKQALRYQALQHYLGERREFIGQLQHLDVNTLDITPQQLPAAVVNTYLNIKGSGRL